MAALHLTDEIDPGRAALLDAPTIRGGQMLERPAVEGRVFEPDDVFALTVALDRSCDILVAGDDVRFRRPDTARYAREVLARLIIGHAGAGVRDPVRLSDAALRHMLMS